MRDVYNILCQSGLFSGFSEDECQDIVNKYQGKVKNFPAGETVFSSGSKVNKIVILLTGRVFAEDCDIWGNKSVIRQFTTGDCMALPYALEGKNVEFDYVAKTRSEILFLDINAFVNHDGFYHKNLVNCLSGRMCANDIKMSHISKRTTKDKLMSYLSYLAKEQGSYRVTVPFKKNELSEYLSVERCSMSKVMHAMKKEGLLDFTGNVFTLYFDK